MAVPVTAAIAAPGPGPALRQMLAERQHPFLAAGDITREHDVLVQAHAARDYAPP